MKPTFSAWLLVIAAGVNSCVGNLLLKRSASTLSGLGAQLTSPWFLGGLCFYGLNVMLFAKALERLPVSAAYPALAGSGFVLLSVASAWIYKERLGPGQYFGLALILGGIWLVARGR